MMILPTSQVNGCVLHSKPACFYPTHPRTPTMRNIDTIYINGAFVTPHGHETAELINPATEAVIGHVRLGDREDTLRAIAAAKQAWPAYAHTSKAERIALLHRLHDAVLARADDINAATTLEYGGPASR